MASFVRTDIYQIRWNVNANYYVETYFGEMLTERLPTSELHFRILSTGRYLLHSSTHRRSNTQPGVVGAQAKLQTWNVINNYRPKIRPIVFEWPVSSGTPGTFQIEFEIGIGKQISFGGWITEWSKYGQNFVIKQASFAIRWIPRGVFGLLNRRGPCYVRKRSHVIEKYTAKCFFPVV